MKMMRTKMKKKRRRRKRTMSKQQGVGFKYPVVHILVAWLLARP